MIIALDYDGTYTEDTTLWDHFVEVARGLAHEVHVVTMRAECEPVFLTCAVDQVHYTDRSAKLPYMQSRGIDVDIWIDDRPDFILGSATSRGLVD